MEKKENFLWRIKKSPNDNNLVDRTVYNFEVFNFILCEKEKIFKT